MSKPDRARLVRTIACTVAVILLVPADSSEPRAADRFTMLLTEARFVLEEGDLQAAERMIEAAARIAPDDPKIELYRGELAEARGRTDDAIAHYSAALEKDPCCLPASLRLGEFHDRQGRPELATAVLGALADRACTLDLVEQAELSERLESHQRNQDGFVDAKSIRGFLDLNSKRLVLPSEPGEEVSIPVVELPAIRFALDSAELLPGVDLQLKTIGSVLQSAEYKTTHVVLEGHASADGTNDYNCELSRRRADAVRDYLVRQFDLNRDRVHLHWYGETFALESAPAGSGSGSARCVRLALPSGSEDRQDRERCSGR